MIDLGAWASEDYRVADKGTHHNTRSEHDFEDDE